MEFQNPCHIFGVGFMQNATWRKRPTDCSQGLSRRAGERVPGIKFGKGQELGVKGTESGLSHLP